MLRFALNRGLSGSRYSFGPTPPDTGAFDVKPVREVYSVGNVRELV